MLLNTLSRKMSTSYHQETSYVKTDNYP